MPCTLSARFRKALYYLAWRYALYSSRVVVEGDSPKSLYFSTRSSMNSMIFRLSRESIHLSLCSPLGACVAALRKRPTTARSSSEACLDALHILDIGPHVSDSEDPTLVIFTTRSCGLRGWVIRST